MTKELHLDSQDVAAYITKFCADENYFINLTNSITLRMSSSVSPMTSRSSKSIAIILTSLSLMRDILLIILF